MEMIVVFYSLEGNTKAVARKISHKIGTDVLEIKPKREVGSRGPLKYIWGGKQAIMREKPQLENLDKDLSIYDLFIIGTPVWAGRPSPPIRTFMEEHLPKGKDLAFFFTYEGGEGKTFDIMEGMTNGGKIISKKRFLFRKEGNINENMEEASSWAITLISGGK